MTTRLLEWIPEWTDGGAAERWLLGTIAAPNTERVGTGESASSVSGAEVISSAERPAFGLLGHEPWRKFAFAALAADWASYPPGPTRVDFARLAYVMERFPRGFRVWFSSERPVGYSGWYPISDATYSALVREPAAFGDRAVLPYCGDPKAAELGAVYLFNYSVAGALVRSPLSSALMKSLAADIAAEAPRHLAAMTVSEDGARIARRFGLTERGTVRMGGALETVFAGERRSPP